MCDSFNKQLLQMGGNSVPAHKGVVHGHIHNYNNLTYIHGHIHKNDVEDGAVPDPDDVLNCAQYQDCEHFEFINCHSLNLFGENGDTNEKQPAVQSNSSQHHLEQQNEQKGPPRFVEITSDDKNEAVPNSLSNALDFLDCHLTCDSPMLEDEDEDEDIEDEDDEEGRGKGRGDEEYTKKELDKILNNDSTSNLNLGAISQQHLQALDNGATSSNNNSKLIHSENFKIANPTLNTPLLNEENGNLTVGVDHLQNGLPDPLSINMKNEQAHQLEDEMNRFLTPSSTNSQNLSVKRESPKSINPSAVNVMDISVKHNNNRDLLGLKPELKSEELHDLKQQCIDMEDNDDDKDTSVDDQLFENLCSQCVVNYELMETPHFHHNSHSHIINTPTDMKVLKDLSSISTLYELLGKHEHTHDNLNENNPQHHDPFSGTDVYWGASDFRDAIMQLVDFKQTLVDPTVWLVNATLDDLRNFSPQDKKVEAEASTKDSTSPKFWDMLDQARWNVMSKFADFTSKSTNKVVNIWSQHPLVQFVDKHNNNPYVKKIMTNPKVQEIQDDFDSARIYLAKWALGVKEQAEKYQTANGLDDTYRRLLFNELGSDGEDVKLTDEELNIAMQRSHPLTRQKWDSFFDSEGRLLMTVQEVKDYIFHGGVADMELRKDVWLFLLEVYPWDSSLEERQVLTQTLRESYRANYKSKWEYRQPHSDEDEESYWHDQVLRVEKDVKRNDRDLSLYKYNTETGEAPASPQQD